MGELIAILSRKIQSADCLPGFIGDVHFLDVAAQELPSGFFQHLARSDDGFPMSRVAVGQFGSAVVGQVFAVVNVEKVSTHRIARGPENGWKRLNVCCFFG
jgi:hypothetical protein